MTAATTLALSLCAAPAVAAQQTVRDPAADAANHGLDIVRATTHNRDHAVVVRVRFVKSVHGDLVVSIDPRGGRGVRLVSEYRPSAHTNNAVLPGAFTDRRVPEQALPLACRGFRVHWSTEAPTVRLRMPARCLHAGDFGAVRFAVLTERNADTDYAPQGPNGTNASNVWIPRG